MNKNIINEAVKYYNEAKRRKLLKVQYAKESALVSKHSLEINKEFQEIDNEIFGL